MLYQLSIPEPCHENWSNMTPTEKGAFCKACAKEVIDFTHASPRSIAQRVSLNKNCCGRFRKEQLQNPIQTAKKKEKRTLIPLLGLTISMTMTTPLFSQRTPQEVIQTASSAPRLHVEKKNTPNDSIRIKGTIYDVDEPLVGANVILQGTSHGVSTDFYGKFELIIPSDAVKTPVKLSISYLGYLTQEAVWKKTDTALAIYLLPDEAIMGLLIVEEKPTFFQRIGRIFRKKQR